MPPPASDDPFSLQGKNPRRVAPQVRRNIQIQKARIWGHLIAALLMTGLGVASFRVLWMPTGLGVVCLILVPFSLLGIYCDWRLLQWQRDRLAECERRIDGGTFEKREMGMTELGR